MAKVNVEVGIIREGKDKDKGSGKVVQIGTGGEGNLDKIQKNSYFFRETFPNWLSQALNGSLLLLVGLSLSLSGSL